MIEITDFFTKLKESIESHSKELKRSELFLPKYLEGKVQIEKVFPKVVDTLASTLKLEMPRRPRDRMPRKSRIKVPPECQCGEYFVVYVLRKNTNPPFFLQVMSLDGVQLSLFWEHEAVAEKDNNNRLWYYYATLANHYTHGKEVPRYFVFLLVLLDQKVEPCQIWDATSD